jgi:hypothetical protein
MDEIRALHFAVHELAPNQDFVRQGDHPKVSALVISGRSRAITCYRMDDGSICPFI